MYLPSPLITIRVWNLLTFFEGHYRTINNLFFWNTVTRIFLFYTKLKEADRKYYLLYNNTNLDINYNQGRLKNLWFKYQRMVKDKFSRFPDIEFQTSWHKKVQIKIGFWNKLSTNCQQLNWEVSIWGCLNTNEIFYK